jgi:hypothetical protein
MPWILLVSVLANKKRWRLWIYVLRSKDYRMVHIGEIVRKGYIAVPRCIACELQHCLLNDPVDVRFRGCFSE